MLRLAALWLSALISYMLWVSLCQQRMGHEPRRATLRHEPRCPAFRFKTTGPKEVSRKQTRSSIEALHILNTNQRGPRVQGALTEFSSKKLPLNQLGVSSNRGAQKIGQLSAAFPLKASSQQGTHKARHAHACNHPHLRWLPNLHHSQSAAAPMAGRSRWMAKQFEALCHPMPS